LKTASSTSRTAQRSPNLHHRLARFISFRLLSTLSVSFSSFSDDGLIANVIFVVIVVIVVFVVIVAAVVEPCLISTICLVEYRNNFEVDRFNNFKLHRFDCAIDRGAVGTAPTCQPIVGLLLLHLRGGNSHHFVVFVTFIFDYNSGIRQ
jgi:hypothetical protein